MPKFSYLALDREGLQVSDTVQANSLALAIDQIRNQGYFPTNLKEEDVPGMKTGPGRLRALFSRKVRGREIARFVRELADMIGAGISPSFSLSILHDRQESGRLKIILGELAADVANGMKFSEALAKHPRIFNALFVDMIRAGEDGGSLETSLLRLANVYEKLETGVGRLKGGARKSSMGLVAGLALGAYLLYFFRGGPYEYGEFISLLSYRPGRGGGFWDVAAGIVDIIAFVIGFFVVMSLLLRVRVIRRIRDKIVLKIPTVRRNAMKTNAAHFSRIMGTLLQNGIPLQQALDETSKKVEDPAVARALGNVSKKFREGETLEDALADSNIFSPVALDMISAGEQTGNLGSMMLEVAEIYDAESRARAGRFSDIAFIAVILLFSGIVTFAVFSTLFLQSGGGCSGGT